MGGGGSKFFPGTVEALPQLNKVIAVTGCTSGTGRALVLGLATKGATLILLNRPSQRSVDVLAEVQAAAGDPGRVTHVDCDLCSFESVRAAGATLVQLGVGIDVLVNNAGVMALPDQATGDGFDVQMQVNHLSHFLLTSLVWPLLRQAATVHGEARVVNHSSIARERAENGVEARYYGRNGGNLGGDSGARGFSFSQPRMRRYVQSKLANLAFTYALRDRLASADQSSPDAKIKSCCAHPGVSQTNLGDHLSGGVFGCIMRMMGGMMNTAEDGAHGILRAACDPDIASGDMLGPRRWKGAAVVLDEATNEAYAPPEARDLMWRLSVEAVGIDDFFNP